MHRADQPTEAHVSHEVLHGAVSLGDSGLVIEGHCKPSGELDQEADQRDATQAIKNVDVGGHVFAADVVSNVLNFKTFLEPVVDR